MRQYNPEITTLRSIKVVPGKILRSGSFWHADSLDHLGEVKQSG